MRFIHAADIHLGSVLHATFENSKKIDLLFQEAVYKAFENLCDYAIELNVDFVLLCGDIYDGENISVKGDLFFLNQCKRLKDKKINVYIIRGNHDPLNQKEELFDLPDNVHVFGSEKVENFKFYKDGKFVARIIGQSYGERWEGRKIFNDYNVTDNSVYNIALLHTQMESKNKKYVPCSINELLSKKNINYWALGHIHKCKVLKKSNPIIAYSGMPQGRDIGEDGVCGCLLVNVSYDLKTDVKFIPTCEVVWKKIYLNVDEDLNNEIKNLNELEDALIKKVEELIKDTKILYEDSYKLNSLEKRVKGYIIQWDICGRGSINEILREDEENIKEYLKDTLNKHFINENIFIYTDFIEINTLREIENIKYLKENNYIFKKLDATIEDILSNEESKKQFIKSFGNVFEKTYDNEEFNDEKIQLTEELIEEIIRDAKEIVIKKLLKGGEEI